MPEREARTITLKRRHQDLTGRADDVGRNRKNEVTSGRNIDPARLPSAQVFLAAAMMCLVVCGGCGADRLKESSDRSSDRFLPANSASTSHNGSPARSTSTAPNSDSLPDEGAPARSTGTAPDSEDRDPARPSAAATPPTRHPLDEVEQGQMYREALRSLDEGELGPARALMEQLAGHPQFGILARAIEAHLLARDGKLNEALAIAEAVSAVPIMRAESLVIAGDAFRRRGDWGDAIGLFRQALELHPDHERAHRWLGALYYDTGAMQLAVDHLRRVAQLDSEDYRTLRLAGLIHREYEMFSDAVKDYREALQRKPPAHVELEIRLELARAHLALRELDEALDAVRPAPEGANVWALRAAIWETQGELDEARGAAERALEQEPDLDEAHFVLGRIALAERDWERAQRHLEPVVQAKPTDHEPRFLLGRALLNSGNEEKGRAHIERATELRETFLALAELHLDAMNRPQDVKVRIRLGELAEQLDWQRVALGWYQAARGLDPDNHLAIEAIQRLQHVLGEPQPQ